MAIKPINVDSTTDFLAAEDPAVELKDGCTLKDYGKAVLSNINKAESMLSEKDGHDATVFTIGVIPAEKLNSLEDKYMEFPLARQLCFEVFKAALVDIKNGPKAAGTDSHGKPTLEVPKTKDGRVEPNWLSFAFSGPLRKVAQGIGKKAYLWQSMGNDDANP